MASGRASVLTAVCSAGLMAGCAGDSEPAEEAEPQAKSVAADSPMVAEGACGLLAPAEIVAFTGEPVGPPAPESIGEDEVRLCTWPHEERAGSHLVYLVVRQGDRPESWESYLASARSALGADYDESDYQHVEDIGDYGVWMGDDRAGVLQVFADEWMLEIQVESPRPARDAASSLARRALARLRQPG